MACHGSNSGRGVAYRLSTPGEKNGGVLLLHIEQYSLGYMGCLRWGLCIDRAADLPLFDEPARV